MKKLADFNGADVTPISSTWGIEEGRGEGLEGRGEGGVSALDCREMVGWDGGGLLYVIFRWEPGRKNGC